MKRRRLLAIAACAALGPLAVAACSSSSSSAGPAASSAPAAGNQSFNAGVSKVVNPSTAKGGTLTFAYSSAPDSFDPGNTYYAYVLNFNRLYASPLVTYKSCPGACGNTLVPGTATGLGQVSSDGLVWTYHIKQGLKFEDGSPVTAADVKYAVERTYDRAGDGQRPDLLPGAAGRPDVPRPVQGQDRDADLGHHARQLHDPVPPAVAIP